MERAQKAAHVYADKVNRSNAVTIIDFMSGYQASEHASGSVKLQEIKLNYEECGIVLSDEILDSIDKLMNSLDEFDKVVL